MTSCWSVGRTSQRTGPPSSTSRVFWKISTQQQKASTSIRHEADVHNQLGQNTHTLIPLYFMCKIKCGILQMGDMSKLYYSKYIVKCKKLYKIRFKILIKKKHSLTLQCMQMISNAVTIRTSSVLQKCIDIQ